MQSVGGHFLKQKNLPAGEVGAGGQVLVDPLNSSAVNCRPETQLAVPMFCNVALN
jgi:hypothetical protein